MNNIPEEINQAWEKRKGPIVLTTVDKDGLPNSIYATCVGRFGDGFVVADNYFSKTRQNILGGGKSVLLFITEDDKAYQLKGKIEYHREGAVFDSMKQWNPAKHPGHAAALLKVAQAYSGARQII